MIEELVNLPGVVSVSSRRQPDASIIFEVYVTALEPSIHEPIAQKELEWFDRFSETATTIQVREAHTSTSLLTAHAV